MSTTATMAPPSPYFVGIDVAKRHLDVALRPSSEEWRTTNDATGIAALVERLTSEGASLIGL
ncbi:MAG: hypothetical protein ACR2PL_04065 [Dehalococcoidia bacterium]